MIAEFRFGGSGSTFTYSLSRVSWVIEVAHRAVRHIVSAIVLSIQNFSLFSVFVRRELFYEAQV